jgi:iron(III) transport system substrate-binding protein
MKRLLSLFAFAAIVTGACTGTASSPSATPAAASQPAPAESGSAAPEPSAAAIDALYERAKAQGKFEFWGGEDAEHMQQFFELFATKYPGVTPTHVQIPPEEVAQKLLTEVAVGQSVTPDLFNCNLDLMADILAKGLVNQDPGWTALQVDNELIDPVGGISSQIAAYGLAYNTNMFKAADMPTTWEGLIDPKFEGKLSLDPRGNPFNILAAGWGKDQTVDYVTRLLATTKPVIIRGATAGLTSIGAGETGLRPSIAAEFKQFSETGAPVGFVWLNDIPVKSTYWYVATGAKNPDAAMLFAYWFATSPEANQLQEKLAFRSNALPDDVPADARKIPQKTVEDYALGADTIKTISPLLSPGS